MISLDDIKNYILIVREEELGNNYKLSEEQLKTITKINNRVKNDPLFKQKLDRLLAAKDFNELSSIWYDMPMVETNVDTDGIEIIGDTEPITSDDTSSSEEKDKQKVLSKAGFVDAFVMALVTGFMGGIATMVVIILLR